MGDEAVDRRIMDWQRELSGVGEVANGSRDGQSHQTRTRADRNETDHSLSSPTSVRICWYSFRSEQCRWF